MGLIAWIVVGAIAVVFVVGMLRGGSRDLSRR